MTDRESVYPVGPGHRCSRGPVPEAYAAADMTRQCMNCFAEPNSWCVHPDGTPRKIPCRVRVPHQPDPEAAA